MKLLRPIFLLAAVLIIQPVWAEDGGSSASATDLMNYIGFGAIILMLVLFVVVMTVLLKAFKTLTRALLGKEAYEAAKAEEAALKVERKKSKGSVVHKLLSLKPLEEEKSILIEHDYDGIQELDNPTPALFMTLFYVTIVFAVVYILVYHVLGIGQLQDAEYKTEMAIAAKEKAAWLAKSANKVDESTVKLTTDPTVITSGQAIFKQSCMPCHGDHAQGVVGPNLTDDYWLHGGKITDVFKTIKYGVSAKGMPTWEKQLSPKQISDVANYVKSLYGTNPAGAKEPQGTKETDDEVKSAAKTAMVVKK